MKINNETVWDIIQFFEYIIMVIFKTFLYMTPSIILLYTFKEPLLGTIVFIGGVLQVFRMMTGTRSVKDIVRFFKRV